MVRNTSSWQLFWTMALPARAVEARVARPAMVMEKRMVVVVVFVLVKRILILKVVDRG